MVDTGLSDVDGEGWSYRADFSGFIQDSHSHGGSANKGMMHFVRRRRLIRDQYFDGEMIPDLHITLISLFPLLFILFIVVTLLDDAIKFEEITCDYCDLREIHRLSNLFLEKFCQATIAKHPRHLSLVKFNIIKNDFIKLLFSLSCLQNSTLNDSLEKKPEEEKLLFQYNYLDLEKILNQFVSSSMTTLSRASSLLSSRTRSASIRETSSASSEPNVVSEEESSLPSQETPQNVYDERVIEFNSKKSFLQFLSEERQEIAKLFIQKYDSPWNRFHCSEKQCSSRSSACPFQHTSCPNKPCSVMYSLKYAEEHDMICPEKSLTCDRLCGEINIRRKNMNNHLLNECTLRLVDCPYQCVGCSTKSMFTLFLYYFMLFYWFYFCL